MCWVLPCSFIIIYDGLSLHNCRELVVIYLQKSVAEGDCGRAPVSNLTLIQISLFCCWWWMSSDSRLWRSSLWVNLSVTKKVNKSCRIWFVSHFSYAAYTLISIHLQCSTRLKRQPKLSSHIPFSWTGLTNSAFLRQQCWTHCQAVIGNFWGSSLICFFFFPPPSSQDEEKSGKERTGDESSRERR